MLLLRLPRHLRPCHLSRGAQQARCISQTGIIQQSADGDDALPSALSVDVPRDSNESIIKIRHVHSKQPKSWWSTTRQSFASLGLGTVSANEEHLNKQNNESMNYPELYNDELAQIKNQLQELSDQFKMLQHTLKEIRSAESDARHAAASDGNPLSSLTFTYVDEQHAVSHSQPRSHGSDAVHEPTRDNSSERITGKESLAQTKGLILHRAMAEYRQSIFFLIHVSTLLEGVTSRFSAKIAIIHARHLHMTIQDNLFMKDEVAMNNTKMRRQFKQYKHQKTWYAKAVYLPSREKESQARSESILRLYLLGRAQKLYLGSVNSLIRIGNELEAMRPGMTWTIKDRFRKQIHAITQIATREEDKRVLTALKDYEGPTEYLRVEHEPVNPDPQHVTISNRFPLPEDVGQKPKEGNRAIDKELKPMPDKGLQNLSKSSHDPKDPSPTETIKRSLLQELFPEATSPQVRAFENYPKLDPPNFKPVIPKHPVDRPKTLREQVVESFQKRGEQITVLQLLHCSTSLVEADFRRLIPKGQHIEAWRREGEFTKIIPGRDPLSLERLPFYYILFKNPESALAYQKNVSRLHKLSALHQPANIFSAIPPPKGFLEDGEDLQSVTSMYNLLPTHHPLTLHTVMQPYNPVLRSLFDRGGYTPIVPDTDEHGKRIWKVLLHIEGYEPTPSDLFKIFRRDAFVQGLPMLTLRNESSASIHRLRDMMNLKTGRKKTSTSTSPSSSDGLLPTDSLPPEFQAVLNPQTVFEDPALTQHILAPNDDRSSKELSQLVINRVYNRWIIDVADEDAAIRFSRRWHRRILPNVRDEGQQAWRETEEERWCNAEVLW